MNPFWQENVTVSDSSRQLLSKSGDSGWMEGTAPFRLFVLMLFFILGFLNCGGSEWPWVPFGHRTLDKSRATPAVGATLGLPRICVEFVQPTHSPVRQATW